MCGVTPPVELRTLVLGGTRSGKSRHAEELVREAADGGAATYVAPGPTTGEDTDPDWAARVAAHRSRRPESWATAETRDLATAVRRGGGPVLVDCLGTWLSAVLDEEQAWDLTTGQLEELVARLRGLLRRAGAQAAAESTVLTVGDLTLDEDSHEVHRGGDEITLTATEFELLRFLMRNPRRVLSKAQILDRVWNYDFGGQANVVELYISYLRKKVDAGREPLLHTVRGVGYMLRSPR